MASPTTNLIATGCAVGLGQLSNFLFRPDKPFRACLLCGSIRQDGLDRTINSDSDLMTVLAAKDRRDEWARRHARVHSAAEHNALAQSGLSMTPEAASRLAAYGVIPLADLAQDSNIAQAMLEASAIPTVDAEV